MEGNLATSADRTDYLVDLSNIARQRAIGGPARRSLHRLHLVVQALAERTADPNVLVYPIADASLLGGHREFADPADVQRLRQWVAGGLVEEVGDADERILEIAGMTGIQVVTGDRYVDHRLEHQWIQGNTWQFLEPTPRPDRSVGLVPIDMGVSSATEISRGLENSTLKKQGLLDPSRTPLTDVLRRSWRCPDPRCSLYDVHHGGRILLPRMRHGRPTCELHGKPLLDDGPRLGTAQIKAVVNGVCVARYTLDEGTETRVGRKPRATGISLYNLLDPATATSVSREHVVISVGEGVVLVRDVSTYGTRMRIADKKGRLGPWEQLRPHAGRRFHPGDEVELSPGVVLNRSGRRFPTELADAWRVPAARPSIPPEAIAPTRPG